MSWKRQDEVWKISGITTSEKCILLALAHCENDATGLCCPSITTLGLMTELSRQGVVNALNVLERKGYIVRTRNYNKREYSFTTYVLHTKDKQVGNDVAQHARNGIHGGRDATSLVVGNDVDMGSQVSRLRSQVSGLRVVKSVDSNRENRTENITEKATTTYRATTTCSTPLTPQKIGGGCALFGGGGNSHFSFSDTSSNEPSISANTPSVPKQTPVSRPTSTVCAETPVKRPVDASEPSGRKSTPPPPQDRATGRENAVLTHGEKGQRPKNTIPTFLDVEERLNRDIGQDYDHAAVHSAYTAIYKAGWKDSKGTPIRDVYGYCKSVADFTTPQKAKHNKETLPGVSEIMKWVEEDNTDGFTAPNAVFAAIVTAHRKLSLNYKARDQITHGYRAYFNGVARRADNQTIQRIMADDWDYAKAVPDDEEEFGKYGRKLSQCFRA